MSSSPRSSRFLLPAVVAFAMFMLAGCNGEKKAEKPADKPKTPATPTQPAADSGQYPIDVCVVSDEKLGEMGEPVVIKHEGREVRFCCNGCVEKFNADPAKYLAKLDQLAAAKAAGTGTGADPADHSGHEH